MCMQALKWKQSNRLLARRDWESPQFEPHTNRPEPHIWTLLPSSRQPSHSHFPFLYKRLFDWLRLKVRCRCVIATFDLLVLVGICVCSDVFQSTMDIDIITCHSGQVVDVDQGKHATSQQPSLSPFPFLCKP